MHRKSDAMSCPTKSISRLAAAGTLALAAVIGAGPALAQAPGAVGPVGLWIDHTGRGAVEIATCGSNLCGRIVWLQSPIGDDGKPLVDELNQDRAKRGKPICGLQIIGGLKRQPDGTWDEGWIYDPEQGQSFDVELTMLRSGQLQVKGYKGFKFLSQTFQWRRADATPGPRCA